MACAVATVPQPGGDNVMLRPTGRRVRWHRCSPPEQLIRTGRPGGVVCGPRSAALASDDVRRNRPAAVAGDPVDATVERPCLLSLLPRATSESVLGPVSVLEAGAHHPEPVELAGPWGRGPEVAVRFAVAQHFAQQCVVVTDRLAGWCGRYFGLGRGGQKKARDERGQQVLVDETSSPR